MTNFSFTDNKVSVNDSSWGVNYLIKDARIIDNKIIILYDPDAQAEKFRQFRNLTAFDFNGKHLWTAEHPTSETADCYIEFIETSPLIVWNFACYRCRIDVATGKLLETQFTK